MINTFINVIRDPALNEKEKIGPLEILLAADPKLTLTADEDGYYPIHHACEFDNVTIVTWLLDHGASADQKIIAVIKKSVPEIGITPVHIAAAFGHTTILEVLTKYNVGLATGRVFPLEYAVHYGHEWTVIWFLTKPDVLKNSTMKNAAFYQAARSGKLNILKLLFDKIDDIDHVHDIQSFEAGWHAIHTAAYGNHVASVQWLLDQGVSADLPTKARTTLMHIAAASGNLELLKLLHQYKATLNQPDENGLHPIHLAARNGQSNAIQFFLQKGISCHQRTSNDAHNTPLHEAALFYQCQHMQPLLDAGALINTPNALGLYPIHLSVLRTDIHMNECTREILNIASRKIFPENSSNETIKIVRTSHQSHQMHYVKLIRQQVDLTMDALHIFRKVSRNFSLKHLPTSPKEEGTIDCSIAMQWLWQHGARIDQPTADDVGDTIAHIASCFGYLYTLKLLPVGLHILNNANKKGEYPIHLAIVNRQVQTLAYLLKQKVPANQMTANEQGDFPMHIVAENGFTEMMPLLKHSGANINAINFEFRLPIHSAVRGGHDEMLSWLIENNAALGVPVEGYYPLHIAARIGHVECEKLLLDLDKDVFLYWEMSEEHTNTQHTPFTLAIRYCQYEIAKLLLESEEIMAKKYQQARGQLFLPLINQPTKGWFPSIQGCFPLHYLVPVYEEINNIKIQDRARILELLLQYKTDINAVTFQEETLLHLTVSEMIKYRYHENLVIYFEFIELLLKHSINVSIQDSKGNTAFDVVIEKLTEDQLIFDIAISFTSLCKKYGIHLDISSLNNQLAKVIPCNYLINLLDFLQQSFPEFYWQASIQHQLTDQAIAQQNKETLKTLANYGCLIGYVVKEDKQTWLIDTLTATNNLTYNFFAIGINIKNSLLAEEKLADKFVFNVKNLDKILQAKNEDLNLRVLGLILIYGSHKLLPQEWQDIKDIFFALLLISKTETSLTLLCTMLDNINFFDRFNASEIAQLNKVYLTIYHHLYKTIPSLREFAINTVVRIQDVTFENQTDKEFYYSVIEMAATLFPRIKANKSKIFHNVGAIGFFKTFNDQKLEIEDTNSHSNNLSLPQT